MCDICKEIEAQRSESEVLQRSLSRSFGKRYRGVLADIVETKKKNAMQWKVIAPLLVNCKYLLANLKKKKGHRELVEQYEHTGYCVRALQATLRDLKVEQLKTPDGVKLLEVQARISQLEKSHPKCAGCTMLFGLGHSAGSLSDGEYCYRCEHDRGEMGDSRFFKRVKVASR